MAKARLLNITFRIIHSESLAAQGNNIPTWLITILTTAHCRV